MNTIETFRARWTEQQRLFAHETQFGDGWVTKGQEALDSAYKTADTIMDDPKSSLADLAEVLCAYEELSREDLDAGVATTQFAGDVLASILLRLLGDRELPADTQRPSR